MTKLSEFKLINNTEIDTQKKKKSQWNEYLIEKKLPKSLPSIFHIIDLQFSPIYPKLSIKPPKLQTIFYDKWLAKI